MKVTTVGLGAVLACLVCVPLSAANIVADPGFEAGGGSECNGSAACSPLHPAWTFIDAASGTDYGVEAPDSHSGLTNAFFAGTTEGFNDIIQQTLATTPGQFYTLSFWLDTHFDHSDADFQVFWNGTKIYDDPSGTDAAHQFPYTQLTFASLQATGSTTVLEFAGWNVPDTDHLDDVTVDSAASGVPEPASWALICAGALAVTVRKVLTR